MGVVIEWRRRTVSRHSIGSAVNVKMKSSPRTALLCLAALLALFSPCAATPAWAAFGESDPIHDFIREIAVDADPSGNSPGSVASVEDRVVVSLGATAAVDVVVDEISDINTLFESGCDNHEESGCGLTRMVFEVTFDPQIVRLVAFEPEQLLCVNGCPNRTSQSEGVPDTDGRYFIFEKDDQSEPEIGEGVLGRFTFQCMAPGETEIGLDHPQTGIPQISDASGGVYPVGFLTPATLTCLDASYVDVNEDITWDLSGDPFDADDTAWRVFNAGKLGVKMEWGVLPGNPLRTGDTVADGFALIDGTLLVQSSATPGELRARYRIEVDPRAVRRAGIRANQLRLMRRDADTGRWGRAVRAIRAQVQGRYLPRTEADFVLGHHGFSDAKGYVWGVVDVNSRYAVGGPLAGASVPLLGPLGLLAAGLALLGATGWELRRRR